MGLIIALPWLPLYITCGIALQYYRNNIVMYAVLPLTGPPTTAVLYVNTSHLGVSSSQISFIGFVMI